MGRTDSPLCPVAAILKCIEVRGDTPGPFFVDSSHKALTKQKFVSQIRIILNSIGLQQDQYAGHSFRIGAATTAELAGVEDSTIQTLGRWHSAAFLQYIQTPKEHLAALSAVLAKASSPSQGGTTDSLCTTLCAACLASHTCSYMWRYSFIPPENYTLAYKHDSRR